MPVPIDSSPALPPRRVWKIDAAVRIELGDVCARLELADAAVDAAGDVRIARGVDREVAHGVVAADRRDASCRAARRSARASSRRCRRRRSTRPARPESRRSACWRPGRRCRPGSTATSTNAVSTTSASSSGAAEVGGVGERRVGVRPARALAVATSRARPIRDQRAVEDSPSRCPPLAAELP
jgi:hypothetical protein